MRKRVRELIKLTPMGMGYAESIAQELSNGNNFEPLNAERISGLLEAYNIPFLPMDGVDYYVYFNQHPSSGYSTVLYVSDEGAIAYKVNEPRGMVMCAFWTEIIIFELTDRY